VEERRAACGVQGAGRIARPAVVPRRSFRSP
jgi:hypothetical protein